MELRILSEHDAPEYYRLRLEGLERAPRAFGSSAEEYRRETPASVAPRLKPSADAFTLGAFEDGALVGAVTFVRFAQPKLRHKGNVFAVYVSSAAQGRGVGRALLRELIAHARATPGVEQLLLAVSVTQDAARALYRSLGFEVFGLERRAIKVGEEYVDEEHMVYWL